MASPTHSPSWPPMADGDRANARGAGRRQPARRIFEGDRRLGHEPEPFERKLIGVGGRLASRHVFLADDRVERFGQTRGRQDGLDILTPCARDDGQAGSSLKALDQFDDSRKEPRSIPEQLHGQRLLAAHPFVDLAIGDSAVGKKLGQELAVVDLGRPCRHFFGDLPSHDGKRPLPGGDVMVVGVRDHAVEIEQNGFREA